MSTLEAPYRNTEAQRTAVLGGPRRCSALQREQKGPREGTREPFQDRRNGVRRPSLALLVERARGSKHL